MAKEDERPRSNRGKGELPCVSYQRGDGEAMERLGGVLVREPEGESRN